MSNRLPPGPSRAMAARGRVRWTLWPHPYGIASLSKSPAVAGLATSGSPILVVIEDREVTLLAPVAVLDAVAADAFRRTDGWRLLTLGGEFPLDAVGVLASLTRALAEAKVPVMAFSSFASDHLLVPEEQLGRALAALSQVSLPA